MGLTVRDDPKKVVDIAGRTWGEPVNGLTLSVQLWPREDPDQLPAISVAIQNCGSETVHLKTNGWLDFFRISVVDSSGSQAPLTSYGEALMRPERRQAAPDVVLAPGKATEADIPIGSIYRMRGRYRVAASCETPDGGRAVSNEIEVSA